MGLRINEGYVITDSIHIGDFEFVLGVSQHIKNDFVTWRCNNGNYYYWGHYHTDLFSARRILRNTQQKKCESFKRFWT